MAVRNLLARVLKRTFDISSPQARAFFTGQDMIDGAKIASTETVWREQWAVRRCVTRKAENLSKLEFQLQKGETVQKSHWFLDFLKRPNPYYSTNALWYLTSCYLDLYGECFWMMLGKGQTPDRMEFIHPRIITAILSSSKFDLIGWRIAMPDGKSSVIDPMDIVQFKLPNPYNRFRGASPMESLALTASNDLAAQKWNLGFFQRGAIPAGVLVTDRTMTPEQAQDFLDKFEARQKDSHRPALLHGGMDYKETMARQREMEFMLGRKMNREEILGAFGVPPVIVGLPEYQNFATATVQRRVFWEETMLPLAAMIADTVDRHIIKDDSLEGVFNSANIADLRETLTDQLDGPAKTLFSMGMPFRVINDFLGLGAPKYDGDEVGYVMNTLVPVDDNGPIQPEPTTPPEDDTGTGDGKDKKKKKPVAEGDGKEVVNAAGQAQWAELVAGIRQAAKRLRPYRRDGVTPEMEQEIYQLIESMKEKIKDTAEKYYSDAATIGADGAADLLGVDFDVTDSGQIAQFIADKVLAITGIEDTTKDKIADLIQNALEGGLSVQDVADQLRADYNFGPARAEMIARTEMSSTVNGARNIVFGQEGVQATEWMSAKDDRVRETHAEEDGNVALLGDEFPVTGCRFPGDPDGDAEEIINCRCTAQPADADQADASPTGCRSCGAAFEPMHFQCTDGNGVPTRDVQSKFCEPCLLRREALVEKVTASYARLERRFASAVSRHFFRERSAILKILLGG